MASAAVEVHTQDGAAAPPAAAPKAEAAPSKPLIPTFVKSVLDSTVSKVSTAVETAVKTEIQSLPQRIYDAATALPVIETSRPSPRQDDQDEEPALSKSQELWNDAYDGLANAGSTSGIVKTYADTLAYAIEDDDDAQKSGAGTSNLAADLQDPAKRQLHMREIVKIGREKFADDSKIAQGVGDVAGFVLQARGIIDVAISNIPQAALPWAGVCVGLQILTNPAKASRENLEGITHVVSRMDWYCSLVDHLLDERSVVVGKEPASAVMQRLETLVLDLYKKLLLYQMKSVGSYYRNSGLTYIRDLASWDDWQAELETITAAEEALRAASVQYNTQSSLKKLSELMQQGEQMKSSLGNIHQDLQDFIAIQKEKISDEKDSACLRDLFLVDPMFELKKIERKKDDLVDIAFSWVMGTHEYTSFANWKRRDARRLLWLKGGPGTGKTMLLMGIVREMTTQSAAFTPTVTYYFCQGTADRTKNSATAVLRGLLWMLLVQQPRLISHLRAKHKYAGSSLFTDSNAFSAMSEAFENMLKDTTLAPAYFIVDSLDECDDAAVTDLTQLIFKSLSISRKVKWIVSSRPGLDLTKPGVAESLVELDPQRLQGPVHAYITHKLSDLKEVPGYDDNELQFELSSEIFERASNTFLWAALAFQQLQTVEAKDAVATIKQLPPGLTELYDYILAAIEKHDSLTQRRCKKVLAAVFLAYRPLTLRELSVVADLGSPIKPETIVKACGSLLTITGRKVSLVHQSAREFLQSKVGFFLDNGDIAQGHEDIVCRSILAMMHTLKRNIYGLPGNGYFPKFLAESVHGSSNDPLGSVAYCCTFWLKHLCEVNYSTTESQMTAANNVLGFFKNHFLRWIESLSLLGKIPDGQQAIRMLAAEEQFKETSGLQSFLHDADKFLSANKSTIKAAALQTYGSALLFSPAESKIRQLGWDERLPFIRQLITTHQTGDTNTQTLEGHYGSVTAVAFSEDGNRFATGTEGSLTIWKVEGWSAICTIFLPESKGVAEEMSFSPDSQSVLAVCGETIHVCDIETKTQTCTVTYPEKRKIVCANFHSDNKNLVLVLGDATVHTWDASTQKIEQVFTAQGETKSVMALSPNNKTLAVSLLDSLIGLWDVATGEGQNARVLKRHDEAFRDFTFSADSKTLGSVSTDGTICLWDILSGTCKKSFSPGWNNWPTIALSPDLKTIAMGGLEDTTRLLDVKDWSKEQEAQSHRSRVLDICISPDKTIAATASNDKDIRLWDIETGECIRRLRGHKDAVNSVAFSHDGKVLASASDDKTVRLWDVGSGESTKALKGHTSKVRTVTFSPDGQAVASYSDDTTVRVWTIESGSSKTLKGHSETQSCIAFSNDSKSLAAPSKENGIILWDVASGNQERDFDKVEDTNSESRPTSLVFSPDDASIMMGCVNGSIYALDKAKGSRRQVVCQQESFSFMRFAPDGATLITTAGSVAAAAEGATSLNKKTPEGTLYCYKPLAFPGMEGEARLGDVWIEGKGVLMLLPSSYTSNVMEICEDIIILGHASGKVTFLYLEHPVSPGFELPK